MERAEGEPGARAVSVSFLGPFRRFSEETIAVPFEDGMTVLGAIDAVAAAVDGDFRDRALERTTTVIVNKTIINWEDREDAVLSPGDNVTFALFMGGG